MHNAKTRGRRPEAYYRYVEDRAIPEVDKVRRERTPGTLRSKEVLGTAYFPNTSFT